MDTQPDEIDAYVGARIRAIRKSKRIPQQSIAKALSVTSQQVQKYEKATNRVSASMLIRTARHLGVPVRELLPPEDEGGATAPMPANLITLL